MKYLYYSKTLVELIEALNSKKELKSSISSLLQQFIAAWQGNGTEVRILCQIYLQKMAGLLKLNTSISSINLYLCVYLISKNYNIINIFQMAKSSYFQFKKDSRPKHTNNTLRIYTYSAILPKDYQVNYIGLRKLVLGLKGEYK